MFIFFKFIILCGTIFHTESRKCDCNTFQIYYSENENIHRDFTEQTAAIDGRPIYYSKAPGISGGDIIWWNEGKKSWMGHEG